MVEVRTKFKQIDLTKSSYPNLWETDKENLPSLMILTLCIPINHHVLKDLIIASRNAMGEI